MTLPKWIPKWVLDILLTVLIPLAKVRGLKAVVDWMNKEYAKEPNWGGTGIIILYRVLVVNIKPLADRTDNDWDNEAVDIVIAAITESATANGVPLPDVTIKQLPAPVVNPLLP